MAAPASPPDPQSGTARRTVAVVDMVGYNDVVRMLEQNLDAGTVADLNRQIQSFINRSLEQFPKQLPGQTTHCVISRPGDGAILLFHHAEDAHTFARQVHLLAKEHNDIRSLPLAQRWFRIGLATGDVNTAACKDGLPEYAGAAIATATRLEAAANPGEIVIDTSTFGDLTPPSQARYGPEQTIQGKRIEVFRVHRSCVTPHNQKSKSRTTLTRRSFVGVGATALVALGSATYFEIDYLEDLFEKQIHPRFVALLAWPKGPPDREAMMDGLLESVGNRLSRAESSVRDLLILTTRDMMSVQRDSPQDSVHASSDGKRQSPGALAEILGTNLILGVHTVPEKKRSRIAVTLYNTSLVSLRQHRFTLDENDSSKMVRATTRAAARLLGVTTTDGELTDEMELASVPLRARQMFEDGRHLASDPNGTNDAAAIEKYQEAISLHPRFSQAFSGFGNIYLRQYEKTHEDPALALAGQNIAAALHLNPESETARLANVKFRLASGKPDAALEQIAVILHTNPLCSDAMLLKGMAYSELSRPGEEETSYRDLVKARPNYWYAFNQLGICLHNQAKHDEAIDCFKRASMLAPRAVAPLNNLGSLYVEKGRTQEATMAFDRSNGLVPNETAYEYLGNMAFEAKNFTAAVGLYQKAFLLSPNNHFIVADTADCYVMLGNTVAAKTYYANAAEILTKQLRANPTDGSLWMTLAIYHARMGTKSDAEWDIASAKRYGGTDIQSRFSEARALMLLGKRREAENLVLLLMDKGLLPAQIEAAPELNELRSQPRYKLRLSTMSGAL